VEARLRSQAPHCPRARATRELQGKAEVGLGSLSDGFPPRVRHIDARSLKVGASKKYRTVVSVSDRA
jgi:hypothetical protein